MARVTADEVKEIYEPPSELSEDEALQVFINIADRFVTTHLGSTTLTTAQLKDVTLWLSPYFCNVLKPQPLTASVLSMSQTRTGLFSYAGMLGDPYGQRAIEADPSDTLLDLATKAQAAGKGEGDQVGDTGLLGISSADQTLLT